MKRILAVFAGLFVLLTLWMGLRSQNPNPNIASYDWKLEALDSSDVHLRFGGDNSFRLVDQTGRREWDGDYTLALSDSSPGVNRTYRLNLQFADSGATISGVLGTRVYQDGTKVSSITLDAKSAILSFVAG